jgi:hypothetical protein
MWIPDQIYEHMPLAYAAAGVASWFAFGLAFPSVLSTVALFAASVLTFVWRRNHRLRAGQKEQHRRPPAASLPVKRRD